MTRELVSRWWVTTGLSASSPENLEETVLIIAATSSALAYLRYITAIDPPVKASWSNALSVFVMFLVTTWSAESMTEFDGVNGTAIKLFIVGLFWAFRRSRIRTASTDERLFSLIILIAALSFWSKVDSNFSILWILDFLSTNKIELIDGMLDKCDCLPVIALIWITQQ